MLLCNRREKLRSGFSLLELLLVIFIISLVYFLGFEGVEKSTKPQAVLTPQTLKETVTKSKLFKGQGTLICINRCKNCYLREDISAPFEEISSAISLGETKVYLMNTRDELFSPDFGRYQDSKICLQIDFYPNGSSTQMVLQNEKGIYFLPAFFEKAIKVESLEDAKEHWLTHLEELKDKGNYY